jgi:RNase P/RNase MRP subunit p29
MTCLPKKNLALAVDVTEFVKGSDVRMVVQLQNRSTRCAQSIPDFSGATARFQPETGDDAIAVTGSLVSEDLGTVAFEIDSSQSELMLAADGQTFEVEIDQAGEKTFVQLEDQLTIRPRLF